jgi:Coenzyme F390 synthetase
MIWNPNKECMSRDEMSALQGKRLHKIVKYVYHNVPFYRNKLQEMDLTPDDIRTIDDIVKLPFTTKQDLRDNYPFGLQAAPPAKSSAFTPLPAPRATPPSWAIPGRTSASGPSVWRAASLPSA